MQAAALAIPAAERARMVSLFEVEGLRARRPPPIVADAGRNLHWFVVTVSPLCEKAVSYRIARFFDPSWSVPHEPWAGMTSSAGVVAYAPTCRRRRKVGQRRDTISQVLFPRYLFVGFEEQPPWFYLYDIPGLQGVLGIGGRPAELQPETIGSLMFRCETGQLSPPPPPKLQRGMSVVATAGEFRGFEGSVACIHKKSEQVDVLFDLFSKTPVTLSLDDVSSVAYDSVRLHG